MRTRLGRLIERWRRQPDPVFRAMVGLSAVLLALLTCTLSVLACVTGLSWSWSQLGPGGMLSEIRVGQPAPDFTLESLDGGAVSLRDYRGATVAVNLWASWCMPCVLEIPELNAAVAEHGDAGLVVLGVNVGEQPERVRAFAARQGIAYPVLLDTAAEVWNRYGAVDWPTTVWVDAAGVIRAVDYGKLDRGRIAARVAELGAAAPQGRAAPVPSP